MAKTDQADTEVGYCKPPRKSQFKKGKSGNPGGRPKGAGSFAAAIRAEGLREVTVGLDGTRATAWEVVARNLLAKAAKGDAKLAALLYQIERDAILAEVGQAAEAGPQEIEVRLVLEDKPPASYCVECGIALDEWIAAERAELADSKLRNVN